MQKTPRKKEPKKPKHHHAPPGKTIESRENQITRLAYDLVEKRIKMGTATSQEVSHFLKVGSSSGLLEKEKLVKENLLLTAKTDLIKSQKKSEELFNKAIEAMGIYRGQKIEKDSEDVED